MTYAEYAKYVGLDPALPSTRQRFMEFSAASTSAPVASQMGSGVYQGVTDQNILANTGGVTNPQLSTTSNPYAAPGLLTDAQMSYAPIQQDVLGLTADPYSLANAKDVTGLSTTDALSTSKPVNAITDVGYSDYLTKMGLSNTTEAAKLYQDSKAKDFSTGDALNVGLGLGQLGLGIASFQDTRKTNKANRDIAKENLSLAKQQYADRQQFKKDIATAYA